MFYKNKKTNAIVIVTSKNTNENWAIDEDGKRHVLSQLVEMSEEEVAARFRTEEIEL